MASIQARNGKYAVVYYEGDDRHAVMKSGLTYSQAEKLKAKKNEEERKWREEKRKERKKTKPGEQTKNNNAGEHPTDATVEEFIEDFIVKYGTKHWGDSYFTSSRSRMNNYVYPYFGQHRIVDVTTR